MTKAERNLQDRARELADRLEAVHDALLVDAGIVQRAADAIRSGRDDDLNERVVELDALAVRQLRMADEIAALGEVGMLGRTASGRVSELARERRPGRKR